MLSPQIAFGLDLPLFYIIFLKSQLYIVNNLFYEIST